MTSSRSVPAVPALLRIGALLAGLVIGIAGCGGGGSSTQTYTVTITDMVTQQTIDLYVTYNSP